MIVKHGKPLGGKIKDVLSIVSYSTFRRWVGKMEDGTPAAKKKSDKTKSGLRGCFPNVRQRHLHSGREPTPVLVSIYGGGFRGGKKSVGGGILKACLDSGISVMAITYRLSDEAIAPAQFLDSARAIQFIRHNAKEWNIDPTRIASTGGSAGAGISLWLGFHEDLADPDNEDPVLRQSTRLLRCDSLKRNENVLVPINEFQSPRRCT